MISIIKVLSRHKLTNHGHFHFLFFLFSVPMFAGTAEQVDTVLCNKHKGQTANTTITAVSYNDLFSRAKEYNHFT